MSVQRRVTFAKLIVVLFETADKATSQDASVRDLECLTKRSRSQRRTEDAACCLSRSSTGQTSKPRLTVDVVAIVEQRSARRTAHSS